MATWTFKNSSTWKRFILLCACSAIFLTNSAYGIASYIFMTRTVVAESPGTIVLTFNGLIVNDFNSWPYCGYSPDLSGIRYYGYGGPGSIGGPEFWQNIYCHGGDGLGYTISGGADNGTWFASGSGYIDYNTPQIDVTVSGPPGLNLTGNDRSVGGDSCTADARGMARYSVHSALVSLNINDTPVGYSPPYGPAIDFTLSYSQRESRYPTAFDTSNMGPKWTFKWIAYVIDEPNSQRATTSVFLPGGGMETYVFNAGSSTFARAPKSDSLLVQTGPSAYERRLPDGSRQFFTHADHANTYPRKIFMTRWEDASGQPVSINYDENDDRRIDNITDALGQVTRFAYEFPGDPLKVTKVTDPFARFATFEYFADGKLKKITDPEMIESEFTYRSGTDFVDSLKTPYGIIRFDYGEVSRYRWLEITGPDGQKERIEYRDQTAGFGSDEPVPSNITGNPNPSLASANTFYWDKKAMASVPRSDSTAKVTHWLSNPDGSVSGIPASIKAPLENRIWYKYDGQPDNDHTGTSAKPIEVSRVLADNTTSLRRFEYNDWGNTTKQIDPLNRVTSNVYATNQIDLLSVFQRNPAGASTDADGENADLIASNTYDPAEPPHRPATTTDAARRTTTLHYNNQGQPLWVRNAKNETTSYGYGDGSAGKPLGYLTSITSPAVTAGQAVTLLEYDGANRLSKQTEPDGYYRLFEYDNLDRQTRITFPDNTTQEFLYTDTQRGMTLDLTASKDRRGLWTYRHYDNVRRLDSMTDPENRTTHYDWCSCGSLQSITDPENHTTMFLRDLQGRVYRKQDQDGTGIDYLYEGQTASNQPGATSRLAAMTDAKNQRTNYAYGQDDNLTQISYTDTNGAPLFPVTPTVTYGDDPNYNRVTGMDDGSGHTSYAYHPVTTAGTLGANQLQTVDGPLGSDVVTYSYDQLGRSTGRSINGVAATMDYDALGRVYAETNDVLGGFSLIYDSFTPRLFSMTAAQNGQVTTYHYFGGTADRRLQYMESHQASGTNLSRFDYIYDPEGEIMSWTKLLGSASSGLWFNYDAAQQLRGAQNAANSNLVTAEYVFGYDLAENRVLDSVSNPQIAIPNGTAHSYTPNNVNQLADVTTTTSGSSSDAFPLSYDPDGNMTYDAFNKTFEWDAANRLVAINYLASGQRSEFAYDGANRRTKIVERGAGQTAVAQPAGTAYSPYASAPFTATTGNYIIRFEGLRSGATALIDAVTLNGLPVPNGSFETPPVGPNVVPTPMNATWTFTGDAGIVGNRNGFANAPDGTQAGYVENDTGVIQQTVALAAGVYTLAFKAAQGPENKTPQQVRVTIENTAFATTVQRFVWNGNTLAEERESTGATVKKRFFAEGEQRWNEKLQTMQSFYYTRDHLGSIREVTDASGGLQARYDYDVWGNSVVVTGNMSLDFGFTGHYFHAPSGLNLTLYRGYSPMMGRWLSRDPIAEAGGLNLYGYVGNNPINRTDPLGLCPWDWWDPEIWGDELGDRLSDWYLDGDGYVQRYLDHVETYYINPGPYASALAVGVWPKSLAPGTGGRITPFGGGPANPITSVPSAAGVPGARTPPVRALAAGVGVATVGAGFWNVGVAAGGLIYAGFPPGP